jgi:hypothetical protein
LGLGYTTLLAWSFFGKFILGRTKWLWPGFLLAFLSGSLSAQERESSAQEQERLTRLSVLIGKLQLRNRTQSEQYQILLELSNSSAEQLEGLRKDFDLNERELALLRSIGESQGAYINSLLRQIEELTRISTRQSLLLKASLLKNKVLTVSVVVLVPAALVLGLLLD